MISKTKLTAYASWQLWLLLQQYQPCQHHKWLANTQSFEVESVHTHGTYT